MPDGFLWADANGGYDEATALDVAPKLATAGSAFDTMPYLSPHSDVVALMVFNHQLHMTNLLIRLGWESRIADHEGCKRIVVKRIVQTFLDEIVKELSAGNRLEFRDFGVFETRVRAARTAQNPKTLDRVPVPSKRTVKFKIGRQMKAKLGDNADQFDAATGLPIQSRASGTA